MSEPLSQSQAAEQALFRGLVDDQLTPEEFAALEQRLVADREFRLRCVRYMDLEASLYEAHSVPALLPDEGKTSQSAAGRPRKRRWFKWAVSAAVLAGLTAASIALIAVFLRRGPARPGAEYVEAKLRGLEVAA